MFHNTKMYYDAEENVLKNKYQQFIKRLDCPLNKSWEKLNTIPETEIKRFCEDCKSFVLNINELNSDQVEAIVRYDPDVCVYFSEQARHIQIENSILFKGKRVIYTARTIEAMNVSAKSGFRPLIKDIVRNDEIKQKITYTQDPETWKVTIHRDYRLGGFAIGGKEYYWYNPECYEFPFAAYLIPPDLHSGDEVLLDDLIEEYVGSRWNQGDTYRLRRAFAVWNGSDFDVNLDEKLAIEFVG